MKVWYRQRGREHALAWKFAQSPLADGSLVAPGNAGTALEPRRANVAIAAADVGGLSRSPMTMRSG